MLSTFPSSDLQTFVDIHKTLLTQRVQPKGRERLTRVNFCVYVQVFADSRRHFRTWSYSDHKAMQVWKRSLLTFIVEHGMNYSRRAIKHVKQITPSWLEVFLLLRKQKRYYRFLMSRLLQKITGKAKSVLTSYKLPIPELWQNTLLPFLFL